MTLTDHKKIFHEDRCIDARTRVVNARTRDEIVWKLSGGCLVAVWRVSWVSGRCLEGVLRVSGGYLWDVRMVLGMSSCI